MLDREKNKGNLRPYLANINVRWGYFDFENLREMRFEDRELSKYGLEYGDIVMCEGGEPGRCAIWKNEVPGTVIQKALHRIRPHSTIDHRYLYYIFLNYGKTGQFAPLFTGSTINHLPQDKLALLELNVPPLGTQHRIADILSAYDDLIENNTRRIAILEEMARSLYREWFVNFRFPGHESVEMVESPIGLIPDGWSAARLRSIARDRRIAVDPLSIDASTPYVGLEHIPRRSIALADWGTAGQVQSTKLQFEAGHILFGKIRPYFHKVAVAPVAGVCSSDAIVIEPLSGEYASLVMTCVSSDDFVAHASQTSQGTKMPRASWDVLLQYPVALPDPSLLAQFNGVIERGVELIHNLVKKNRILQETRDLLLPKLISGELSVEATEEQLVEAAGG